MPTKKIRVLRPFSYGGQMHAAGAVIDAQAGIADALVMVKKAEPHVEPEPGAEPKAAKTKKDQTYKTRDLKRES